MNECMLVSSPYSQIHFPFINCLDFLSLQTHTVFPVMSSSKEIEYSDKYADSQFEYRHVILPKETAKLLPQGKEMRLLHEDEWRALGVQQSRGWVHYEIHRPEPHVLLFRRPIGTDPITGKVISTSVPQQQQQQQQMMMPLQPVLQQQRQANAVAVGMNMQPQAMKKTLAAK
jgi:cyclin-dependent kinase regulatory subunit CKS1